MDLCKDDLLLAVLFDEMPAYFALWEITTKEKGELDLRLLFANKSWLNVFNLTEQTAFGKLFGNLAPQDAAWLPILTNIALGKVPARNFETYSEERRMHVHRHMYSPKHGQVVTLNNDRSHLVKSMAEQEERERKVAALFQLMPSGFCICDIIYDENNKPVDVWVDMLNNVFETMGGFRVGSLQGRRLFEEYPDYDKSVLDIFNRVVKTGEKASFMIHQPNSGRMYEVICYPYGVKRFMCVATDVTDRVKAEQKIKSLAAIVAIADAGIIVKDKNGVVLEWNIGAENILGYSPEEIIGKTTHYYAQKEEHANIDDITARLRAGEHIVHVEVVRNHKDGRVIDCSVSYTPIFDKYAQFIGSVAIFHDISDKKQMELALRKAVLETEEKHQIIMSSIDYAGKIQKNLLPRDSVFAQAFSDHAIIWSPRDTVSGDVYWVKNFDEGAVLCVCDCTGHGTPGALLTMLVVSAFEDMVNEKNYKDTAQIIWNLEQRLINVFNMNMGEQPKSKTAEIRDGCDLAVLYIAKDASVTISAGNIHVFVCDGKAVRQIKGQRIFVGEGKIKNKNDINVLKIPANPDNKFYIASDGLFDQIGGVPPRPFGYKRFRQIILNNHHEKQSVITDKIWQEFKSYQGRQLRRDDLELIAFKP